MSFFKLLVDLDINASGYQLGLKKAEGAARKFSETIEEELKNKLAGAFGTVALEEFARRQIEAAKEVLEFSQRVDTSTDSVQEWGYAAKKAGSDAEEAMRFLENIAAMREKAAGGDQNAQDLFGKFGIGIKDMGQSADELGRKIGNAFRNGNTQEFIGALKELGGKGSTALIPAFKDGIDELSAAAHEAGRVLDTELLVRLKAIGDEIKHAFSPGSGGAKVITWFADRLRDAVSVIKVGTGGLAAAAGTLAGGGSMGDAGKAAMGVLDEEMKTREEHQREIQRQVDAAAAAGTTAVKQVDKLIAMGLPFRKDKQVADTRMDITPWQQIGAAMRFDPSNNYLRNIDRNTALTAENTKGQAAARLNGVNGLFGEQDEWQ